MRKRITRAHSKETKRQEKNANKSIFNVNLIRVLLFLEHCFVLFCFAVYSKIHSFFFLLERNSIKMTSMRQNKNYNA